MKQKYSIINQVRNNLSWLDISLGFAALAIVVVFYIFFKRDVIYIDARFKVTDESPLYMANNPNLEYALSFQEGDSEQTVLGSSDAQITSVQSFRKTPETEVIYLDVKLKTTYDSRKNIYYFRGRPVVFGETHTFNFSKVRFKGLVVDFPGFEESLNSKVSTTKVRAQLRHENREFSDVYGVPDYLASSVKAGDEMKDKKGAVLARVVDVKVEPAKRSVFSDSGQVTVIPDPLLKDVYYTLELKTMEIHGKKYINDYQSLFIGNVLFLNFEDVSVWPTITEIIKE